MNGSKLIFVNGVDNVELEKNIQTGFELWGLQPKCKQCKNRGIACERGVYNAPDTGFFYCADWRK